jgi:hypothetical protein
MNAQHDYELMEREYITGDMGMRELARLHGIRNHSLITAQARKREWVRKREEYRAGAADKAVIYMADQEGARRAREARVRDNAIDAIDEAISKLRSDMRDTVKSIQADGSVVDTGVPIMQLKPTDIAMLIDRLQVLFGRPSTISEERSLGINLFSSVDASVLRSIVEATRGLGPLAGDAASSPIPRIDRAREN